MKWAYLVLLMMSKSLMAGTYVRNLWPKKEVVVCFAKGESQRRETNIGRLNIQDWSEPDKLQVKNWVNSEYTLERTGIHFTKWRSCEDSPEADVVIFYNLNNSFFGRHNGLATMGQQVRGSIYGYPQAEGMVIISKSGMKIRTVLHEFGHLAGLGHEHNHPRATKPYPCSDVEPIDRSYYYEYTSYDKNSIMHYCNSLAKTLSAADVALLKSLYK